MIARLICRAPAKVNLDLRVVGRRPDGYHLLDSLVAFADLADTLTIEAAETLSLTVAGSMAGDLGEGENLVLAAARALQENSGVALGARLHLLKRIPVAAGLGGGSADAAATLIGLAQLWQLDLPAERLAAIGARLGADIPACLAGGPLLMRGIGDRIEKLPQTGTELGLLLANPGTPMPTRAVFAALARLPRGDRLPDRGGLDATDRARFYAMLAANSNDLEAAAVALSPSIATTLALLRTLPSCRHAAMSGSGATCLALFDDAAAAAAAGALLRQTAPDLWMHSGTIRL